MSQADSACTTNVVQFHRPANDAAKTEDPTHEEISAMLLSVLVLSLGKKAREKALVIASMDRSERGQRVLKILKAGQR